MKPLEWMKKHQAGNILLVFIILQIICSICYFAFPKDFNYLSIENLQIMFKSIPQLAILAIGAGMLMIAGEFDLSVGSNFVVSAYCMAVMLGSGISVWIAIPAALAIGTLIGLLNAVLVLRVGMPSFIATLGTMMFWKGIVLVISQGVTKPFRPEGFSETLFAGFLGPIQVQFIWLLIIAAIAYLLLERHKFGNHIYAVGGNRYAAVAIGVNANKVKLLCFMIMGFLSAFSAIISTMRVHSVSPVQGQGLELQAIAACVIGGVSLRGGQGSIMGVFLGAALLFVIQDILLLLRAPGSYLDLFMGVLIIVAVIFNNLTRRQKD